MLTISKKYLWSLLGCAALILAAVTFSGVAARDQEEKKVFLPLIFRNVSNLPQEKIAFMSDRDGNFEIYIMNADGTDQVNITNHASADYNPYWNPIDNRLAFVSHRNSISDNYGGEIFTMNADGTDLQRLTTRTGDAHPSWSPDGTKIVFQTWRDGEEIMRHENSEIYVMNADGSNVTRLTNNTDHDFHPNWSPDGSKIVFFREGDLETAIYIMNSDGTNQTRITIGYSPSWSADGSRIIYTWSSAINSIAIDGTDNIQLTNSSTNDGSPSPSFDGTKIVFKSKRDGNSEIYVMNNDGTEQTNLTNHPANDYPGSWGSPLK